MSINNRQDRKTSFTWHTRDDIYSSFLYTGLFDVNFIDKTVETSFEKFIVREGTAINIDEFWQKVGETLDSLSK